MKRITALDVSAVIVSTAIVAGPAVAGAPPTPSPLVGAGIGSLVLIGAGYRALKRRLDR